jgi:hypothetical protein
MANQFQHISGVAVKVLARLAAKKVVKEQLRQQGVRGVVPHREIVARTKEYLGTHPELYEQALASAWAMAAAQDQQGRINAVLFDDVGGSLVDLSLQQITPKWALKSLRFSVQPEVISTAGAY